MNFQNGYLFLQKAMYVVFLAIVFFGYFLKIQLLETVLK